MVIARSVLLRGSCAAGFRANAYWQLDENNLKIRLPQTACFAALPMFELVMDQK